LNVQSYLHFTRRLALKITEDDCAVAGHCSYTLYAGRGRKYPRQIRATHTALIVHIGRTTLLRAVGTYLIEPVDDLAITAPLFNQALHLIAIGALALETINVERIELADEVSKDDCVVAGHLSHSLYVGDPPAPFSVFIFP